MEYKAPERYILHLLGKRIEEVKLFIDDTWAKMVSCKEQKHGIRATDFLRHKSS